MNPIIKIETLWEINNAPTKLSSEKHAFWLCGLREPDFAFQIQDFITI